MAGRLTIDTGITGTYSVTLPRPSPVRSGRGAVALRTLKMALHDGETPEDLQAFAAHLTAVWTAYIEKRQWRQ